MTPNTSRLTHLFGAHTHGTITPAEHAELRDILRSNPEARRRWFLHQDIDAGLQDLFQRAPRATDFETGQPRKPMRPSAWRPVTAAAAGLLLGLFSASMVLGLGVRTSDLVFTLLREGFEQGRTPHFTGVPAEEDIWSGDFCEITREQQGVHPAEGLSMVRVLRSDYAGRNIPRPSRQGDLMRVVDVKRFGQQREGIDVVLSLSARFNVSPFPSSERYDGMVTVYALAADVDLRNSTEDSIKEQALAFSIGECRFLDRNPNTWQAATTQLLLPAATESVMLKVSFRRSPLAGETLADLPASIEFSGHFLDDVSASLRVRHTSSQPAARAQP